MELSKFSKKLENDLKKLSDRNGLSVDINLLVWYMMHYLRLDEDEARDLICDNPNDKKIDGLYVDKVAKKIVVFQSKHLKNKNSPKDRELGDIRIGMDWVKSENIETLKQSRANEMLKNLVERLQVKRLQEEEGYQLKGILVCSGTFNDNFKEFFQLETDYDIDCYDIENLCNSYEEVSEAAYVKGRAKFVNKFGVLKYPYKGVKNCYLSIIYGKELTELDGIVDESLFAKNVRYYIKRANKIAKRMFEVIEHNENKNFMLYHNGITLIAEKIKITDNEIEFENYSIINGCQTTVSLYKMRHDKKVSLKDICIPIKLIEINMNDELIEKVTLNTNNQNSIKQEDLLSNDEVQLRLKKDFELHFPKVLYRTKNTEVSDNYERVVSLGAAAQLIMSFVNGVPERAHTKNTILRNPTEIFTQYINSYLIVMLDKLFDIVGVEMDRLLENKIVSSYKPAKFFVMYMVKELLVSNNIDMIIDAKGFYEKFADDFEAKFKTIIDDLLCDMSYMLQYPKTELERDILDYKNEFRNRGCIDDMKSYLIRNYNRVANRDKTKAIKNIFS